MKNMRRHIERLVPLAGILFPALVFAQTVSIENPLDPQYSTIPQFIEGILMIIVRVGIPVAVLFIVYAGFLFVTAQGNTTQLEKAKNALIWALIGSAILLGALVLARAVGGTVEQITG